MPRPTGARHARSRPRCALAAVFAACFLASAFPRASASDYQGDYALYSGYHSGCEGVALGIEGPGLNVTNGDVVIDGNATHPEVNRVLYARFHVRTPDVYQPSRLSGDQAVVPENSLYYTLFVLGGVGARGEGGYFGGFKASGNETEAGLLFFGIRGADASGDSILAETPHRRLNGEATKVEFAFGFHNNSYGKDCSSLRMYADGELVLWEQCVPMDPSNAGNQTDYYNSATNSHDSVTSAGSAIPNATSGPLSIGRGSHDPELSKFIDPLDSGGCFSPNFHGWTGDLARGPHVPPGNLACGERNRWGEFDGGDVMWCPHTWKGSFPTAVKHAVSASLAGFDPRDNDCEAVAYARAAPMYSAAPGMGDDKWQRNNMALSDDSHSVYTTMMSPLDEGHVNLRRLGRHPRDTRRNGGEDWWGEKFAFARFRFTTPEYFGRLWKPTCPTVPVGFRHPTWGKYA